MTEDREEIYIIISNNIRAERSRARMSQDDVAEKLGIDRKTYTNWENRPKFDSIDIFRLARILGCTIESFYLGLKATKSGDIIIKKREKLKNKNE